MGIVGSKTLSRGVVAFTVAGLTAACASGGQKPELAPMLEEASSAEATASDTLPDVVVAEAA